ncbi:MAG: serine/threonine-protein kinase [Microcoleaceae cyanobacterium]
MTLNPGQTLHNGKYTIKQELKRRQYDITYLAERSDGEKWVIKTLNPAVLAALTPDERDRLESLFWQEAIKIAKCSGTPHIVKAEMPFQEGEVAYLPIEYLDANSLAERAKPILTEAIALKYMRQIGEALTIVHQQGIIHRDICPENIFLRIQQGEIEAVLTNFGLALDCDAILSQTRKNECRDGFSPIELYSSGQAVGSYTDIYSLAATLYELLTGKVPPSADKRQIEGEKLISPQAENTAISGKTAKAILAGMALSAEKRPQSVEAWLKKLNLKKITNESANNQINWEKWGVIWAAIGVIVGLLVGIPAWLTLKSNTPPETPNPPIVQPSP